MVLETAAALQVVLALSIFTYFLNTEIVIFSYVFLDLISVSIFE